ncbi:MAG: choline-sulfatase [Desulfovibrionaceae bacterium]|jgi:choline-sulfatase|nr:choline-sulfatase [Desulfovibrionaceae bacterium]
MADETRKPNVLLIQVDQMTAKVLPSYGHEVVKAPNITRLAEEGVVFENAYCNFPLCAPSRMSMLSGRFANSIGVWDNATEALSSTPTLMHYLRGMGYCTALCGKMHFVGPDQLHGYEQRLTTDIYPSNYAWAPDWEKGLGDRPTGINLSGITQAGTCLRSLQIDYDDEVEYFGVRKIFDLARYEERPFFLTISFTQPHSPFVTRPEYWDLYEHDDIDLPTVPAMAEEDMDEMSRWIYHAHAGDLDTPTEDQIKNARHAYYGMVSTLDEKVGNILQALKDCGLYENTAIIFTSDHGDMLGERGQWYKQLFYEWSARVPYIFHWPGTFKPGRIARNVSLVDLAPTVLDIVTGGDGPRPVKAFDGRSLWRFLTEGADPGRDDTVICEYTGEGACAPCRMVRRGDIKYIYTHGHPDLVYDLARDPDELVNVAEAPAYAAIRDELKAVCLNGWNPATLAATIKDSQKDRLFIRDATDCEPTWAYRIFDDDDRRYVRKAGAIQTKAYARLPRSKDDGAFK